VTATTMLFAFGALGSLRYSARAMRPGAPWHQLAPVCR
jgi:hypothetical protein